MDSWASDGHLISKFGSRHGIASRSLDRGRNKRGMHGNEGCILVCCPTSCFPTAQPAFVEHHGITEILEYEASPCSCMEQQANLGEACSMFVGCIEGVYVHDLMIQGFWKGWLLWELGLGGFHAM